MIEVGQSRVRLRQDPVYWRLVYDNGRILDEAPTNSTIREAWKDPIELHVVKWSGELLHRIIIPPGCAPIWYRNRSIGIGETQSRLDATVLGFAYAKGNRIEGTLWAFIDGQLLPCPEDHYKEATVEFMVQDYTGAVI